MAIDCGAAGFSLAGGAGQGALKVLERKWLRFLLVQKHAEEYNFNACAGPSVELVKHVVTRALCTVLGISGFYKAVKIKRGNTSARALHSGVRAAGTRSLASLLSVRGFLAT